MDRVNAFTQSAAKAKSENVLKILFSATIKEVGYHGFDAFSVRESTVDNADVDHNFFVSDYSLGFVEEYVANNWLQMDSSLLRVGKTSQPFDYVRHLKSCPSNASIKWQRMMMKAQNVHQAWLLPFNIVGATRGVTCYMRGKGPGVQKQFFESKHEIQLLAGELMARLEDFNSAEPDVTSENSGSIELSAREIDCLHWAARGKSNSEIGAVIDISENTVRFHLKNAFVKLDVNTRTKAVISAASKGLIEL